MVQLPNYPDFITEKYIPEVNDVVASLHFDGRVYVGRVDSTKGKPEGIETTLGTVIEFMPRKPAHDGFEAMRFRYHLTTMNPLYKISEEGLAFLKQNSSKLDHWQKDYERMVKQYEEIRKAHEKDKEVLDKKLEKEKGE